MKKIIITMIVVACGTSVVTAQQRPVKQETKKQVSAHRNVKGKFKPAKGAGVSSVKAINPTKN